METEQLSSCDVVRGDARDNPDSWYGNQPKWFSGLGPLWFSIALGLSRNKCKCNSGKICAVISEQTIALPPLVLPTGALV